MYMKGLAEKWKMMPEEDKEVMLCFDIDNTVYTGI